MSRLGERFVLEDQIGAGGMARVYKGKDLSLDRDVAVKVLNPGYGGTDIGRRFQREGRTAASLAHPNIVQVYDAGEGEFEGREVSYIVMEYVPGGDLKGMIDEKGSLPNDELARLGADVSAGLAHAHERGVIHRDIKPHNILLDGRGQPKLTDFGIARALDATQATQTGSYLGTALYSPPEQLRGERATPKSDVYSLGIALYQAATGQAPFSGTPIEVASQHVSRPPTTPSVLGANLDREVEALIVECIEKDPARRPSAKEVERRLREAVRPAPGSRAYAAPPVPDPPPPECASATPEEPPAAPPPRPEPQGERARRSRRPVLLAAAALVLVLLGAATAFAMLREDGVDQQAQTPTAETTTQQQANVPENTQEDTQPAGGGVTQAAAGGDQPAPAQTAPAQPSLEQTELAAGSDQGSRGGLTEEAAIQTVRDHYEVAASDNYPDAWNFLSTRYQQQWGSPQVWTDQFATLERVEYTQGPVAQINGDTATVTFSTRAQHEDRVDQVPNVTMTLVQENGEWKIDNQV